MKKKANDEAFEMVRHAWCEKCSKVTPHTMQLASGTESIVNYLKCCNDCYAQKLLHEQLGLEPIKLYWENSRMATADWNFLVQNPNYYDP